MIVHQPRATVRGKTLAHGREGNAAPVIMIARHSKQRRLEAGQNGECLRQEFRVLDEVAGEAMKSGASALILSTTDCR